MPAILDVPSHRKRKNQVNTRLSDEAVAILHAAQDRFGLTYTGVMEMALRELQRAFKLEINPLIHGPHATGSRGGAGD